MKRKFRKYYLTRSVPEDQQGLILTKLLLLIHFIHTYKAQNLIEGIKCHFSKIKVPGIISLIFYTK